MHQLAKPLKKETDLKVMAKKKQIFAEDVSRHWKQAVRSAEHSIIVFTPFLDNALATLLKNTDLPSNQITLITECSTLTLLKHPPQLRTLKQLLENGIQVKQLPKLHAKILLLDEDRVFLGSQNFTYAGRKNLEASAYFGSDQTEGKFLENLNKWIEEAETLNPEWIDLLIEMLAPLQKKHKALVLEAEKIEQEALAQFEKNQCEKHSLHFDKIVASSALRLNKEWMLAFVEDKISDSWSSDYKTLLLFGDGSLNQWKNTNQRNDAHENLTRLDIFPALITESMRMAFVRVGKTRITYFRDAIKWRNLHKLGGAKFWVNIKFPKTDTRRRNISITLEPSSNDGFCRLDCFFDGKTIHLKQAHFSKRFSTKEHATLLKTELLNHPLRLSLFLEKQFSSFKFSTLDRENKNLEDYLKGSSYKIGLAEFEKTPFYILQRNV